MRQRIIGSAVLAAALALLPLAPAGQAAPPAASAAVAIVDAPRTSPDVVTVAPGDSVTFRNAGILPHNVVAENGSFRTGVLKPGESETVTFWSPGTVTYYCSLHTSQFGTVVVLAPEPAPAPADPDLVAVVEPAMAAVPIEDGVAP